MATFIQQHEYSQEQFEADPKPKSFRTRSRLKTFFCSRISKGVYCILGIGTLLVILYIFVLSKKIIQDNGDQYYCLINEENRLPCGSGNVSKDECERMLCCFNATTLQCHHYSPSKYFYKKHDSFYEPSQKTTPYGKDMLDEFYLTKQELGPNKFSIILHNADEFVSSVSYNGTKSYIIEELPSKLIINVRNGNDTVFATEHSALIASEDYWEWSFQFTVGGTIYGLDRNLISLSGSENITKVIYKSKTDHTTEPVFWAYYNGFFYSCVINHDGPLELQVLSSNTIIMRSLTGKKIEIGISIGTSPAEIYGQRAKEVAVPPLWMLGTHICRSSDTLPLSDILTEYSDNRNVNFDTDCIHKNLFVALQRSDTTDDDLAALKSVLQELVASGTRFLLYLPPHILADEANPLYVVAIEHDILYKHQSGSVYSGSYLGERVVFPDYADPDADKFVQELIEWISKKLDLETVSGLVLSDNYPEDDDYDEVEPNYSSYTSEEITKSMRNTLPWNVRGTDNRLHLETHNSYGSYQYNALYSYFNNSQNFKDMPVISYSKSLADTEPEISDNYEASWTSFNDYLGKILFNSITGNPMVGMPICGDTANYSVINQETLCLRWYLAAASLPYFLVSSGDPYRDPESLNTKYASKVANLAMDKRKMLQDYFYTIMMRNEPLVRPMYYDYFIHSATLTLQTQYTIGSELIIAHPFSSGRSKLQVYLPPEKGNWYEFWGGTLYAPQKKQQYFADVEIVETDWVMFVAQGNVIALTNGNQLNLYIAFACDAGNCTASGDLYKDNNLINFEATNSSVTIGNLPRDCSYTLGYLKVYGYDGINKNMNLCLEGSPDISVDYL